MNSVAEYLIAGLGFRLETTDAVIGSKSFIPFSYGGVKSDWRIRFREIPQLPDLAGDEVFRNYALAVYCTSEGVVRRYHCHTDFDRPYAVAFCDDGKSVVDVAYLPEDRERFASSVGCFAHIGFEELLAHKGRLILHASLVDTPYGGILFSGDSGVGKSTQADLWVKYEGGVLINGDRPILSRSDRGWIGHGSPYAGSSECYVNKSVPIAAVVMLEQGRSCRIRRVNEADAFRKLYAQTTMNSWNEKYVSTVCDMLMDMASSVPVYHMCCTPDRTAVETVKQILSKDCSYRTEER